MTSSVISGYADVGWITHKPEPSHPGSLVGMSNSIIVAATEFVLANSIALRSDPLPLSFVFVTKAVFGGIPVHPENSLVLPPGSVAVAVMNQPDGTPLVFTLSLIAAVPLPFVLTSAKPRKRCPFPKFDRLQVSFAKNSILNVVDAADSSEPVTFVVAPPLVVTGRPARSGKFCPLFAPPSTSPVSFAVTPSNPRSIPVGSFE